jgi:hypothetical protein
VHTLSRSLSSAVQCVHGVCIAQAWHDTCLVVVTGTLLLFLLVPLLVLVLLLAQVSLARWTQSWPWSMRPGSWAWT